MAQISLPKAAHRSQGGANEREIDAYVSLFLEGWTAGEIAAAYRRTVETVSSALEERGYKAQRYRVGDEAASEWPSLYLDKGWTLAEIASTYRTSPGTVRYHLARQGVKIRHPAYYKGKRRRKKRVH